MWWGDEYYPEPAGPPRRLLHTGCGGALDATFTCRSLHTDLQPADVTGQQGPGYSPAVP